MYGHRRPLFTHQLTPRSKPTSEQITPSDGFPASTSFMSFATPSLHTGTLGDQQAEMQKPRRLTSYKPATKRMNMIKCNSNTINRKSKHS